MASKLQKNLNELKQKMSKALQVKDNAEKYKITTSSVVRETLHSSNMATRNDTKTNEECKVEEMNDLFMVEISNFDDELSPADHSINESCEVVEEDEKQGKTSTSST